MEDKIKRFLAIDYGSGSGSGDGSGYGNGSGSGDGSGFGDGYGFGDGSGFSNGSGYGYGYGSGDGYGFSDGSGYGNGSGSGSGDGSGFSDGSGFGDGSGFSDGSGYGYGYGDGLSLIINGHKIYNIDDMPSILYKVFGNFAKGGIVNPDLTITPCYIAKNGSVFAHGKTIREANDALNIKLYEDQPVEDRINEFVNRFSPGSMYRNTLYYDWHHILTGSCKFGRDEFIQNHGIDLNEEMTPEEFIKLTENSYGKDIIERLKPFYNI